MDMCVFTIYVNRWKMYVTKYVKEKYLLVANKANNKMALVLFAHTIVFNCFRMMNQLLQLIRLFIVML